MTKLFVSYNITIQFESWVLERVPCTHVRCMQRLRPSPCSRSVHHPIGSIVSNFEAFKSLSNIVSRMIEISSSIRSPPKISKWFRSKITPQFEFYNWMKFRISKWQCTNHCVASVSFVENSDARFFHTSNLTEIAHHKPTYQRCITTFYHLILVSIPQQRISHQHTMSTESLLFTKSHGHFVDAP